jgi:vacuolar-type H+-ATPase subunit C/Vma6
LAGGGRYAELSAAVRSFKAELTQPAQMERFVESGSLSEIVGILTHGQVTLTEGVDPNIVEGFLTQRMIALTNRLASYAPQDSRSLIRLFAAGHELECVKAIIRSIVDRTEPEDALKSMVRTGKFTVERTKELIEARNLSRVVDLIHDDALREFVGPKLASEKSVISVLSAIDQFHYLRLWNASNLPDPLDAQSARGLIGEFIDDLNILLCLRARLLGLEARSASDMTIPVNYALGHSLTELAESTTVQNLLRVIEKTPYGKALEGRGLSDGSPAFVERALYRRHAVSCLNAFAGSPFNIGLALAFLFLKNYELHDLFSIINGKASKASAEKMLESLILRGL